MKQEYTILSKTNKDLIYRLNKTVNRLKTKLENGSFIELSKRKKQQLLKRLHRYLVRLKKVGYQHAVAASIFGLAMSMTYTGDAQVSYEKIDSAELYIAPDTTALRLDVLMTDIDGDGDQDLFIGKYNSITYYTTLEYYSNEGSAVEPNFVKMESEANPLEVVKTEDFGFFNFVDLDNDGDQDLVSCNYYGNYEYYKNEGDAENPSFVLEDESNPFDDVFSIYSNKPSLTDVDGDGDLDLLVYGTADSTYSSAFYRNTGDASNAIFTEESFEESVFSNLPEVEGLSIPVFSDVDGDGDQDLFLNDYFSLQYYKNEGTLTDPDFVKQSDENNPFTVIDILNNGYAAFVIPAFGDIDGDGDMDIAALKIGYDVDFYENTSTPSSVEAQKLPTLDIFPTLTEGIINISSGNHDGIDMLDMNGRKVSSYNAGETQINISSVPAGIYHLRVKQDDAIGITKIVKI